MRCNIPGLCAVLAVVILLPACSPTAGPAPKPAETVVKPAEKPRSPHHVMVSLGGGAPMTRDQQAYLIKMQEKITPGWLPVPAKLKYAVGIEFDLSRTGTCSNARAISSNAGRKTIECCRDAVLRATPFDPLPPEFKTAPQSFLCEFMYNPPADASGAAVSGATATNGAASSNLGHK